MSNLYIALIAALVTVPVAAITAYITAKYSVPKAVICPLCEGPLNGDALAHYACGQRFHRECVEMGYFQGMPLNGICVSCALPWKKDI